MAYDEEVYDKLVGNFELLCNIIRQNTDAGQLKVDLSKIEEIINKKIPDTLKKNAPEDFYELYTDFKSEYEKFRDFILYDKLIGKNIIALGGGFSSGKSSFLNALMGKQILPADIDPSTSVPTYIVCGDKHDVLGINVFDTKVQMQPRDIRKIAHGFGELEDDDDENVIKAVTLGHVLENIFFSTPLHKYDNIAFLDTPGYSKPDSEKYSAKTDEQIARGQLNSSNYILWFVQADAGTITEEDIKFIKTLREDIPKLIIVNKADKKNVADLKDIIAKIRSTLDLKGIGYMDVFAFTSKLDQVEDGSLREFIEISTKGIKKQIDTWNSQVYASNFARNFKVLFIRCREYYTEKILSSKAKIGRINSILTRSDQEKDRELLQILCEDVKSELGKTTELQDKLKELQNMFFSEIKLISDKVGIAMPEPREIDLIEKKDFNVASLLGTSVKETYLDGLVNGILRGSEGIPIKKDFGGVYFESIINEMLEV